MDATLSFLALLIPVALAVLTRLPAFSRDGRSRHAVSLDLDLMEKLPRESQSRRVLEESIDRQVEQMVRRRSRPTPPEVLLTAGLFSYLSGSMATLWLAYRNSAAFDGHGGEVVAVVVSYLGMGLATVSAVLWAAVRAALWFVSKRDRSRAADQRESTPVPAQE